MAGEERGGKERGAVGRREKGREGSVPNFFFLQFNHCLGPRSTRSCGAAGNLKGAESDWKFVQPVKSEPKCASQRSPA